jgi:hypothetical protein
VRPRAVAPPCPPAARVLLLVVVSLWVAAAPGSTGAHADEPVATPPPTSEPTRHLDDVACGDPLVVHRPDGSVGEAAAVAITSQALRRDAPGWASVGWQAAPGTTLTSIFVATPTGIRQHPGEPSGTASEVLELAFCGTHDPTATASAEGGDRDGASAARTAPVRFDRPVDAAIGTFPASVLGAALGLAVGAVVLLLSHSARRDREAKR